MADGASHPDVFDRRFILSPDDREAHAAQHSLLSEIEQRNFEPACRFAIRLAFEEALSNAFKHGNKNDPGKVVTVQYRVDPNSVVIDVQDEGGGFDLGAVPDPTEEENLEIPAGRGIVLMKAFMTDVSFHPPGNRVRLTYVRPGTATG